VGLGGVDREGRVVVARVGGGDRVGCRRHVGDRLQLVDVARDDRLERDLGAYLDGGGLVIVGMPTDLGVGDVNGEHDAAARRIGVGVEQPERLTGGREHGDVLEFLVVTARVGLAQRRGNRETVQWRRPRLAFRENVGQARHR
jgi:hypothetical protein